MCAIVIRQGYLRDTWRLVQSALKCNEIERSAKVKPAWGDVRVSEPTNSSCCTITLHVDEESCGASRDATMGHEVPRGGNADFSTISVILGECVASGLILKQARSTKEWSCSEEASMRGVSPGLPSQSCQVGPFPSCLYIYLSPTKHRSFFQLVRLSARPTYVTLTIPNARKELADPFLRVLHIF